MISPAGDIQFVNVWFDSFIQGHVLEMKWC